MKSTHTSNRFSAITAVLAAGVASLPAHPGHSLFQDGAGHALTSPDHLVMLALAGAGLFVAGRIVQRQLPRRVLQIAGAVAIATAAILFGA